MVRHLPATLALFLLPAIPAPAQSHANQSPTATRRSTVNLIERSEHFPVEYQASLLFMTLDHAPKALTQAQRVRFLGKVFDRSVEAKFPSGIFYGGKSPYSLAHQDELDLASSHLDALDIMTEVVRRFLDTRPARAQELFQKIALPRATVSCSDAAVPNEEQYFATWKQLAMSTDGDLDSYLEAGRRIKTGSDLEGYLHSLADVALTREQWQRVGAGLESAISLLTMPDREVFALQSDGDLAQELRVVLGKLQAQKIDVRPLLASYRLALTRSLTGQACTDASVDRAQAAASFNSLATSFGGELELKLTAQELAPRLPGTAAQDQEIPLDKNIIPLMQRFVAISDANTVQEYKDHQAPELEPEAGDIGSVLAIIHTSEVFKDACEVCRFQGKQGMYSVMLNLLPAGEGLKQVVHEEVDLLANSPVEEDNPPAWLLVFNQMMNTARAAAKTDRQDLEKRVANGSNIVLAPSPEAAEIRQAIAEAKDPLMQLYWEAETRLQPKYELFGAK